jgi:hypothetical protein
LHDFSSYEEVSITAGRRNFSHNQVDLSVDHAFILQLGAEHGRVEIRNAIGDSLSRRQAL